MRPDRRRAWLLVLAVLAGCASRPEVHFVKDPGASFRGLESYAWMARTDTGDARIDDDKLEPRIRRVVDAELVRKGFRPAEGGEAPDFLVGYFPVLRREVSAETVHSAHAYRSDPFWGEGYIPDQYAGGPPEVVQREFYKGTLILDVAQPATMRPVWRATAEMSIDIGDPPERTDRKISRAVRLMLAAFPPEEP